MTVNELIDLFWQMPTHMRDKDVVGWVSPTHIAELDAIAIETEQTVLYFGPPRVKL